MQSMQMQSLVLSREYCNVKSLQVDPTSYNNKSQLHYVASLAESHIY